MRTVFTDGQTKRLEALFELTDYPTVEARADVARSTGLSEETVRVSPTRRLSQMTNLPPLMELRKTSPAAILRMTHRLTKRVSGKPVLPIYLFIHFFKGNYTLPLCNMILAVVKHIQPSCVKPLQVTFLHMGQKTELFSPESCNLHI